MNEQRIIISKDQLHKFTKTLILYNVVIIGLPFSIIWGTKIFSQIKSLVYLLVNDGILSYIWAFLTIYIWIVFGLLLGIIFHELLHAFTFMLITRKGLKTIEFGFIEKPFIPYVHFKEPITIWSYRIIIIMPGILLGIIPSTIGIWLGSIYLTAFGIIFIIAAAGDFLVLQATKGIDSRHKIRDLPDQIGFEIIY